MTQDRATRAAEAMAQMAADRAAHRAREEAALIADREHSRPEFPRAVAVKYTAFVVAGMAIVTTLFPTLPA